jgi:hypothetical protein
MKVTSEPLLFDNDGSRIDLVVDSGASISYSYGRTTPSIGTVAPGSRITLTHPIWVVSTGAYSEVYTVAGTPAVNGVHVIDTINFAGTLTPGSGQAKLVWPFAVTLFSVRAVVGTAPTGADVIVDVNVDGASAFTTQANRPKVVATTTIGALATPDVTAVAAGLGVNVDIDQIGSTIAGADLTVLIERA